MSRGACSCLLNGHLRSQGRVAIHVLDVARERRVGMVNEVYPAGVFDSQIRTRAMSS